MRSLLGLQGSLLRKVECVGIEPGFLQRGHDLHSLAEVFANVGEAASRATYLSAEVVQILEGPLQRRAAQVETGGNDR